MYTSNGKNSPEGIEDLEFGFLERGCLSSVPTSAPPEGAGGGGDEDRWWCSDGGVEGGEEERTGCDADLNFQTVNFLLVLSQFHLECSGGRRELGRGFAGLAGDVGRERGERGGAACSGIVWFATLPPPRPSSHRGIELLEPCRDLKLYCCCCFLCDCLATHTCSFAPPFLIRVRENFPVCSGFHCQP